VMFQFKYLDCINLKQAKFLGVGLLNTIVGYSIYAIFIALSVPYLTALFWATIIGVAFNYCSTGRLVFKTKGGLVVFVKFIAAYAIIYFINSVTLKMLVTNFHFGAYVSGALCVPISVIFSWTLMNYWVYKND